MIRKNFYNGHFSEVQLEFSLQSTTNKILTIIKLFTYKSSLQGVRLLYSVTRNEIRWNDVSVGQLHASPGDVLLAVITLQFIYSAVLPRLVSCHVHFTHTSLPILVRQLHSVNKKALLSKANHPLGNRYWRVPK